MSYDLVIAVDWSARSKPSPVTPTKDSIFICVGRRDGVGHPTYHRTRFAAIAYIRGLLDAALAAGERVFLGFDFAFGYPAGFARALTGRGGALAVWDWLAERIEDAPDNSNNRFDVAGQMNRVFPGEGPFWGCPHGRDVPDLPERGSVRKGHGMAERRLVEGIVPSAQPVWKLFTTGSVGSQTLMGVPHLARLRAEYGAAMQVWPMESGWRAPEAPITLAEIYPTLMKWRRLIPLQARFPDEMYHIPDAVQVRDVVECIVTMQALSEWPRVFGGEGDPTEEGWIFGASALKVRP